MTWRRRMMVATVTLGTGMICFQPVMRARMESRLSEIMGGRVEIGSSKISIKDGSIALRDIVVHPTATQQTEKTGTSPAPLKIQHAALKFNWNSLLFRNLMVENLLASDVAWELAEPSSDVVPKATEIAVALPSAEPIVLDASNLDIEPIVQPLKIKMADVAAKQSIAHLNVSSRIKSVLERLAEVMTSNESVNVLRQATVLDDARKELAMLRQAIAEDRLARKDLDKALNSLRQSAQTSLVSNLEIAPAAVSSLVNQSAIQLAKLTVAKEWNSNRPLVHAALNSLSAMLPAVDTATPDAHSKTPDGSTGNELLAKLPVGFTRCVAGKAIGVAQFPGLPTDSPDATSGFELRFRNLSTTDFKGPENPQVTIKMIRDSQQGGSPWLICNAQRVGMPQSDAKQIHFVIERNVHGLGKSSTSVQHANQGWAATVSLPMDRCFDVSSVRALGLDIGQLGNSMVVGKLIGTTQSSLGESNEMLIDIDDSSVVAIEAILSPMLQSEADKRRTQAAIRGTELLNDELLKISSRWDELGDEHTRAHGNWESSIKELNEQMQKFDSVFKRTTRASSLPAR
jgi:hypothetical protein